MTDAPEPVVAGTEELYSRVAVAGADRRFELEGRITFGTVDVFRPSEGTLNQFADLVDRDTWDYSHVLFAVNLEPLDHGYCRQLTVTIRFVALDIVAKPLVTGAALPLDGRGPDRGIGTSRVSWVLEPTDGEDRLRPKGHQLGCLVQRRAGTTATDVLVEAEATIVRTVVVEQERTATMKAPQPYRVSFVDSGFVRLPTLRRDTGSRDEGASVDRLSRSDLPSRDRIVVVFHGRDRRARRELFAFLRSIGLHPLEWLEVVALTGEGSPGIDTVLNAVITVGKAILVLMTPDEIVQLKPEHGNDEDDVDLRPHSQSRPNVYFEAGLALARYPEGTVLVEFGKVRKPSDLLPRYTVQLDNSTQSRQKLANRLAGVGCAVRLNGLDWQSEGNLTPPNSDARPVLPILPSAQPGTNRESDALTFDNVTVKTDTLGHYTVYGEVTCHRGEITTAFLEATFYAEDKSILGSATGTVSDLTQGRTKNFRLTTYEDMAGYVEVRVQIATTFP